SHSEFTVSQIRMKSSSSCLTTALAVLYAPEALLYSVSLAVASATRAYPICVHVPDKEMNSHLRALTKILTFGRPAAAGRAARSATTMLPPVGMIQTVPSSLNTLRTPVSFSRIIMPSKRTTLLGRLVDSYKG